MLDLALHYEEGPILLKDIAKRQQVSERYLEHLMLSLKVGGLINSVRGPRGGFVLARPPSHIMLSEIMQIVEGSIAPVECVDDKKACPRVDHCVTRDIWVEMRKAMDGVLGSTALEDLVRQHREREKPEAAMYYI